MSKLETPMVRAWWEGTGGRICEEYPLVETHRGSQQRRRVDALVDDSMASVWLDDWREFGDPEGAALVMVQAKASALAMPLLGQAVFSPQLAIKHLGVASARSALLCTASDLDLAPIAVEHGVEVVVQPEFGHARPWNLRPDRATLRWWTEQMDGEVVFDFRLTDRRAGAAGQVAHAVVLPDRPWQVTEPTASMLAPSDGSLDGERVIIATSPGGEGFGMYALGQAMCSRRLIELHHRPANVRTVVVVSRDDDAIGDLAREAGIEMVIAPETRRDVHQPVSGAGADGADRQPSQMPLQ